MEQMTAAGLLSNHHDGRMGLALRLFTKNSLRRIINSDREKKSECLRIAILMLFQIKSAKCAVCTNCEEGNNLVISSNIARANTAAKESLKDFVAAKLEELENACYVCKRKDCNGFSKCLGPQVCYKCLTKKCFKSGKQCAFRNPNMHGNACYFCFLPLKLRNERSEDSNLHHGRNTCIHKERVKRVLLYGCEDGENACTKLKSCFRILNSWMDVFAKNIQLIDKKRKTN